MEQNRMPEMLRDFLSECGFYWAVCGGFALDLFLERNIRTHGDIDICVFEKDRDAVKGYVLDRGWRVYEFRGQGKVRPLTQNMHSDAGRNLMCVKDGCELVKFYPCEEAGLLYHRFFHTGIRDFHYLEFLFNSERDGWLVLDQRNGVKRELAKAFGVCHGIPFLAPEIVLLYKARDSGNPTCQQDFRETYPHLNAEQKAWFLQEMHLLYPDGHPWVKPESFPMDGV